MAPSARVRWWRLGPADWLSIARSVRGEIREDNVPIVAAGLAFYAVLGLIPALVLVVSVYGLVTDSAEAERQIAAMLEVLPEPAAEALAEQIGPVADISWTNLGVGVLAAVAGLLWTASNATRALIRGVAIAYDPDPGQRSPLETRMVAVLLALGLLVVSVVMIAVVAVLPAWLTATARSVPLIEVGRWVLLALGIAVGCTLLYRYAPPRDPPRWGSLVPGGVLAAIIWLVASIGFSTYVSSFGNYNETYGVLGGAVVLLFWFFFSGFAVLVGAELSAALERHETAHHDER